MTDHPTDKANEESLSAKLSRFGNEISETLIRWQLPNESEIFRTLDIKRKFEKLEKDEQDYFDVYKWTFRMEMFSGLSTIPMLYLAYAYKREMKHTIPNYAKINKYLKLLFIFGIPCVNLFIFTLYRRYFYTSPNENVLRLRHIQQIRELKKNETV